MHWVMPLFYPCSLETSLDTKSMPEAHVKRSIVVKTVETRNGEVGSPHLFHPRCPPCTPASPCDVPKWGSLIMHLGPSSFSPRSIPGGEPVIAVS